MHFYSAPADRNKLPILAVLKPFLERVNQVLEIGSGTGQHAEFFADEIPHLRWLPSDLEAIIEPLSGQLSLNPRTNIARPISLDVSSLPWNIVTAKGPVDMIYTTNTLHIMGWEEVEAFFQGVNHCLADEGFLVVYGPFRYDGQFTTPSNADFDLWLKRRDPKSGIRDIEAVMQLASGIGLTLLYDHDMPANNQCLIWQRA